jgi:hypothetical protein
VLVGLLANTLFGVWWLDPLIALGIAAVAVQEDTKPCVVRAAAARHAEHRESSGPQVRASMHH